VKFEFAWHDGLMSASFGSGAHGNITKTFNYLVNGLKQPAEEHLVSLSLPTNY
jgi:hypothetical protein